MYDFFTSQVGQLWGILSTPLGILIRMEPQLLLA